MKLKKILVIVCALLSFSAVKAQEMAVKTNLLSDVTLNINLGVEVVLDEQWTVDVSGQYNNWKFSEGKRWKNWLVQPELRYWLCDYFSGHFVGAHIHGGEFNMGGFNGLYNFLGTDARKLEDHRYQGWFAGAGVVYGYAWILSHNWTVEAEIGIGYSYTNYNRYECVGCGKQVDEGETHHYVGPTKAAINLVYVF